MEAARIREQQRRMWRRNDGPEEFAIMTEVSAEEDDPEDSTTMTEASLDESEETARLSERLRQRRQRCVYCHRKLTTASNFLWRRKTGPRTQQQRRRRWQRTRNR